MIGIIVLEMEIICTILLMNFGKRGTSASDKLLLFNDLLANGTGQTEMKNDSGVRGKNFIKFTAIIFVVVVVVLLFFPSSVRNFLLLMLLFGII